MGGGLSGFVIERCFKTISPQYKEDWLPVWCVCGAPGKVDSQSVAMRLILGAKPSVGNLFFF